jgi:hypothetical protein
MKKVEFAGPEWMDAIESKLRRMAEANPDWRFGICEVFTDAPKHLAPDGVIAWHCRVADGKLDFRMGEVDDIDIKNVADYDAILPFARLHLTPETQADYEKMSARALADGKLKRVGDAAKLPPAIHVLHNEMAEITA